MRSSIVIALLVGLILTSITTEAPLFAAEPNLSLSDLGFKKDETKSNLELQLKLEKRTSILKTHQILGLITILPIAGMILTGEGASKGAGNARKLHMGLGIATEARYWTSAAFAIFAP